MGDWQAGLVILALAILTLLPLRGAGAQSPADTVLLSLPADSGTTCRQDNSLIPLDAPPGLRAFVFAVGSPSMQLRDATGRLVVAGPPPREVSVAFDSIGVPVLLVDEVEITRWRQGHAVVHFFVGEHGTGYQQIAVADSAAGMARLQREGPGALQDVSRQVTHIGAREPLDSLGLRRARALAQYLWTKRCPPGP